MNFDLIKFQYFFVKTNLKKKKLIQENGIKIKYKFRRKIIKLNLKCTSVFYFVASDIIINLGISNKNILLLSQTVKLVYYSSLIIELLKNSKDNYSFKNEVLNKNPNIIWFTLFYNF